jgi:hypothetical protein
MQAKLWDIVYCFIACRDKAFSEFLIVDETDITKSSKKEKDLLVVNEKEYSNEELNFLSIESNVESVISSMNSASSSNNDVDDASSDRLELQTIIKVNQKISVALEACYSQIKPLLASIEVKAIITALTIQCDELALTSSSNFPHERWPKLQQKILKIDRGGNYFFRYLEKLMLQPVDHVFALKIFYLCLKNGFVGEYYNNEVERTALMNKLGNIIDNPIIAKDIESKTTFDNARIVDNKVDQGQSVKNYLFGSAVR